LASKLVSAQISNYKSLSTVSLSFRNLTILVGANSSGKSNCLESLNFLRTLVRTGSAPPIELVEMMHRVGVDKDIRITVSIQTSRKQAEYCISVAESAEEYSDDSRIAREILKVGRTKVIDLTDGIGKVKDEDGKNSQIYRSKPDKLALTSAGNFGEKPVTADIAEFIQNWEFYDLDPDYIKETISFRFEEDTKLEKPILSLDMYGRRVQGMLKYWAREQQERFEKVNEDLFNCLNVRLKLIIQNDNHLLRVIEQDGSELPFSSLSDGTLRIIAYCTLLHTPEGPTLIGIEEPERNLHPGILKDIAAIIKRLSQKMQVVITTHSSQLLDCFSLDDIGSTTSVILLRKSKDSGTEAFSLDDLSECREDLAEWMADFGVGSAIYHSNLLQDMLEN
jgi:predicted ATPase